MLPTGYPINSWQDFDFLLDSFWGVRRALFRRGDYSVVTLASRKRAGGFFRLLTQESGLSLEEARLRADEVATDVAEGR